MLRCYHANVCSLLNTRLLFIHWYINLAGDVNVFRIAGCSEKAFTLHLSMSEEHEASLQKYMGDWQRVVKSLASYSSASGSSQKRSIMWRWCRLSDPHRELTQSPVVNIFRHVSRVEDGDGYIGNPRLLANTILMWSRVNLCQALSFICHACNRSMTWWNAYSNTPSTVCNEYCLKNWNK